MVLSHLPAPDRQLPAPWIRRHTASAMSFFEAENTLSAATATGQWAQPDCYGLDVAVALFFPLFLLRRSRNLRERGGGRGDLRLLLFWLFGFPVAPNLTFRHRNSPLRRLAGCEHSITQ